MANTLQDPAVSGTSRLLPLDGIRGLAVLAVLIFHTLPIPDHVQGASFILWNLLARSCWFGVDLFFVLSGFLITRVLLQAKEEPKYFQNFYTRRALRIWPLYFTVLTVALIVIPAFFPPTSLPPLFPRLVRNQLWVWTFLQNFIQARSPHQLPGLGHFWTLAVEEQFYLFWPFVVYQLSRRNLLRFTVAICIAEPFARMFCLLVGFSPWSIRQLTYLRLDSLLFGAALYLLMRLYSDKIKLRMTQLAVASALALICIAWQPHFIPYDAVSIDIAGFTLIAILCSYLILSSLQPGSILQRFFSAPVLRWFGKYSYSIYVFSVPTILLFEFVIASYKLTLNPFLLALSRLACCGAASTLLALFSWTFLESPFLRLKNRFHTSETSLAGAPALRSMR